MASPRAYRRTLAVVLVVLAVAVIGLTAVNVTRGPRILSAQLPVATVTEKAGQHLVLQLDQPVTAVRAEDVSVDPAAAVAVKSAATRVDVTFADPLRYSTTYQVRVSVRGTSVRSAAVLHYSFRTPPLVVYFLRHHDPSDPGGEDQIVRRELGGAEEVAAAMPGIQEYAVAGDHLAVISSDRDDHATLQLLSASGQTKPRIVAEGSSVSQLHATTTGARFGFVLQTDADSDRRLEIIDATASAPPSVIAGLGGQPLDPQNWTFVPGTTFLISQDETAAFYLVDSSGAATPRPLGAHSGLYSFVENTPTAMFQDPDGVALIDLATGKTQKLAVDLDPAGGLTALFRVAGAGNYVGLEESLVGDSLRYRAVAIRGKKVVLLFEPKPRGTRIDQACLSPNGGYLALVTPGAAEDADTTNSGNTLTIIDASTGAVEETTTGDRVSWCP